MSTDTHKWIGSYPHESKKKMMWLNSCGKQHLSSISAEEVYGETPKFIDIFTIASVMSLWRNSDAQVPDQAPQMQQGACKDAMRFRTKTGTKSSSVLKANSPLHFQPKRYRSKVTSLCVSSRQTFNLLKPTTFPENPTEGRINELGISKDFGNDFCTIFKGSNFHGQLQQNCRIQTREFGECKTVGKSMKKRHNDSELQKLQSSSLIVLGILPLLSSVLELQNFTQLLVSQVHVLKKLISCAIIFRLIVVREILKKCEYLRHFKVNKTEFRESNEKNLNLNVSSVSVVNQVLSNMALNQQMYPGWRVGEDDMLPREEDEEGQDDMNFREVPVQAPDFNHLLSGGNGEDDDSLWDDRFMGEQPDQVFDRVPGEPGQLADGFVNDIIIDHEEMAAYLEHVNAPDLPMEDEFPFPLLGEDQLRMGEIMFFNLLGHPDAAEAA